ncbi:MAG TPA: class I SAM-dependent methyltransferase [Pseudonocardia sp.]
MTLAHVIRLSLRAPRDAPTSWSRFWSEVSATGDEGDVLWDASASTEALRYVELLAALGDSRLPVIDIGCGNGRLTRLLATRFPRAIGLDLAPLAVELARGESPTPGAEFRVLDMTRPGAGLALRAEFGEVNVFVRGVLHVLDASARRRMAANVADLVGVRGTVLLAETNHRGPLIGYLESLGAGPHGMPRPLARAITTGIPRPSPFGEPELADCFPPDSWERALIDNDAAITTIPLRRPGVPDTVPGFLAVLRFREGSGRAGTRSDP